MKKRFLSFAAVAAVGALALAGCSSNDGGGSGTTSDAAGSNNTSAPAETSDAPADVTGDVVVWIVGEKDTPQDAVDYLTKTFKEQYPNATLTVERQVWDGLIDKLMGVLPTSDSPDVFEVGNTQAPAFTSIGAFADISDMYQDLGGDDLLKGFVEVGSYDGKFYAAPYYAGSRLVFYRTDMFDAANATVPTTMDEYIATGKALKAAHADDPNFSGIWFPGQDWRNALPYIWISGGDLAKENNGKWEGALDTPEAITGLKLVQQVMTEDSGAPKDGNEADPQTPWCADQAAMLSAPGWVESGLDADDKGGCSAKKDLRSVFALPGETAGTTAPIFLGGSNIGISAHANNPEGAKAVMQIMLSDEYQTILAQNGLVPAKVSLAPQLGETAVAKATAAAASNTKLTPAAPGWTNVEQDKIMEDLMSKIAQGGDVDALAKEYSQKITDAMNR